MDGIYVNGPDIRKEGLKPCKWLKFKSKLIEKYFQINNLIDRMGFRSYRIVATPQKTYTDIKSRVEVCSIP